MALDYKIVSKRINFLRNNPRKAKQKLGEGGKYSPNCHGTIPYLLGVEEFFKKKSKNHQDWIYIEGIPACAGRDLMKAFLEEECEQVKGDYRFGDIVSLWCPIHRITSDMVQPKTRKEMLKVLELPPVKTIEHTALLVNPENERIFHQIDTGKPFEFNTINKYISEEFQEFQKRGTNLFVDFYRLKK